ncbi:hypothetical protein PvtlMGM2_1303, partial [Prevotella sp. MGM2]
EITGYLPNDAILERHALQIADFFVFLRQIIKIKK